MNSKQLMSVYRLSTDWYKRGDAFVQAKTLRCLRRKSEYDILGEEFDSIGGEVFESIINLDKVEDGLYSLITVNHSYDCEYGTLDDYDLKLVPYTEDKQDVWQEEKSIFKVAQRANPC